MKNATVKSQLVHEAACRKKASHPQCHISYEACEARASGPLQSRAPKMKAGIKYSYSLSTHYMIVAQRSMQYTDYACNKRKHFTGAWDIMKEQYGILIRHRGKVQDIKTCYMVV